MLGFRVMAFVQKAVARLHEPEKLETLLQELGKKHYAYGAKQKYVDVSSSHLDVRSMRYNRQNIKTCRRNVGVINFHKPSLKSKLCSFAHWLKVGDKILAKLREKQNGIATRHKPNFTHYIKSIFGL
jgi:hypothetical protein